MLTSPLLQPETVKNRQQQTQW